MRSTKVRAFAGTTFGVRHHVVGRQRIMLPCERVDVVSPAQTTTDPAHLLLVERVGSGVPIAAIASTTRREGVPLAPRATTFATADVAGSVHPPTSCAVCGHVSSP